VEDKEPGKQIWKERIDELGMLVAATLIETNDIDTAIAHLHTLLPLSTAKDALGMAYLQIGDIQQAGLYLDDDALIAIAHGKYALAKEIYEHRLADKIRTVQSTNNLAICNFYLGDYSLAIDTLQSLIPSHSTDNYIFNLATLYELSGESAIQRKQALFDRIGLRSQSIECFKL
jgi:tetratricopeptide (TPR) repeat protein